MLFLEFYLFILDFRIITPKTFVIFEVPMFFEGPMFVQCFESLSIFGIVWVMPTFDFLS